MDLSRVEYCNFTMFTSETIVRGLLIVQPSSVRILSIFLKMFEVDGAHFITIFITLFRMLQCVICCNCQCVMRLQLVAASVDRPTWCKESFTRVSCWTTLTPKGCRYEHQITIKLHAVGAGISYLHLRATLTRTRAVYHASISAHNISIVL